MAHIQIPEGVDFGNSIVEVDGVRLTINVFLEVNTEADPDFNGMRVMSFLNDLINDGVFEPSMHDEAVKLVSWATAGVRV